MKWLVVTFLLLNSCIVGSPAYADTKQMEQMFYPTVSIALESGAGSGTVIKVDKAVGSYILTNYHVIADSENIKVVFNNNPNKYSAFLYSYDKVNDLAIIVTKYQAKYVAQLGTTEDVEVFREVFCISNPYTYGIIATKGIISDVNYEIVSFNETVTRIDCKIAPGSSGGGLYTNVNDNWKLIGIPSGALVPKGEIQIFYGFAVQIERVWELLNKNLLNKGED